MQNKIKIAIAGYGNVGKGAELAVLKAQDMELTAIISRRSDISPLSNVPVISAQDCASWQDKIDVLLLCGGSSTDLIEQTPYFTQYFNTVDSFDTHARIPEHFANVDKVARAAGKISLISTGWDPGLFSLNRLVGESVLPDGHSYTFWGPGVSQGHSDAIRRIPGVLNAKQYTLPVQQALEAVRSGRSPEFTTREKHTRDCYVVAAPDADKELIEKTIKEMPNYFDEYDTTVTFLDEAEFVAKHSAMPHGGFVLRNGLTSPGQVQTMEFTLKLSSNPEFNASAMVAYARAAYRMHVESNIGARTVFDVAPKYLSMHSDEILRKHYL